MTTMLRWTQILPADNPAPRTNVPIATDPVRNRVLSIDGDSCSTPNHQADSWDGTDWTNLGNVPTPSSDVNAMAWDAANLNIVTFGAAVTASGFCSADLFSCYANTVYTYNGTVWTLHAPAHMPSPRLSPVMAYCPQISKVILFGGYNTGDPHGCSGCAQPQSGAQPTSFADTWAWDGSDFTQIVTANHPPYLEHVATLGNFVYGWGGPFTGAYNTQRSATLWKFDGTDWSIVTTAHAPPPRSWPAFAYWPQVGKIILHGGSQYDGSLPIFSDTWSFDGTDWTQETPCRSGPSRTFAGASYDPVNNWLLMVGGNDSASTCFDSTTNQTWKLVSFTAPDATTVAASGNVCSVATLNATVNPHGTTSVVSFDYGLTTGYGNSVVAGTFTGSSPVSTPATVVGLTPGQTYHFRVRIELGGGCEVLGSDLSFVEGACASGKPYLHAYVDLSAS